MIEIYGTRSDVLSGEKSLKDVRKALEAAAIKVFCAPPIKSDRKTLVSTYDESNSSLAATTKSSVTALTYQMDEAIEGSGGKAIDSALTAYSADFDDI